MAFEELKERQSVMWGNGPYERITATLGDMHDVLMDRLAPQADEQWVDLACGTGAIAMRAARAGAKVTGVDLAPALIETAKQQAAQDGVEIDYRVGDCENLVGIDDASYDVASSGVGIMFTPDHAAAAREIARIIKRGGRIGLANWTPEGGLGRMFAMMAPFQPAPPPSSPFDWGREAHVEELLGDAFDLSFERHVNHMKTKDAEEYWQLFSTSYGPTKTLAESLDDDRREEFHRTWLAFFEDNYRSNGGIDHDREWLLVLGTRR